MGESQPRDLKRALPARTISPAARAALMAVGLASWLGGAVASFLSQNGAGAGALAGVGAACVVLALLGRWPSRISMSGNEVSWEEVNRTVDSQIKVVKDSGETNEVLAELKTLRTRLDVLRQTGLVPEHPAEVYDTAVLAAIQRVLPGVEVTRQGQGSRDIADFAVGYKGHQLFVETKWRSDPRRPFGGSTLPRLLENFPRDAKLLVVVSTNEPPRPKAYEIINESIDGRGRIVAWQDIRDDPVLGQALTSLLGHLDNFATPHGPAVGAS